MNSPSHCTPTSRGGLATDVSAKLLNLQSISLSGSSPSKSLPSKRPSPSKRSSPSTPSKTSQARLSNRIGAGVPPYTAGDIGKAPMGKNAKV